MSRSRLAVALGGITALAGTTFALALPAGAQLAPVYPGVTSENVTFVGNFPDTVMISAEFALTGNYFYTSSLDSVAAFSYDIGDTITVTLEGIIGDLNFENESMTYGERRDDAGEITDRFVIVAEDLYHVDPVAATDSHVGGGNVVIVDVTDPTSPFVRSQGEISTSTHTVQCLSRRDCEYAYAVGGGGEFSIVDLRDLDNPVEVPSVGDSTNDAGTRPRSPAAGPNDVFTSGAGHYWDIDDAGIAWQTGSGGAAAFDVSDPLDPVILNATDETGTASPHNDFILHNSMRPNATAFVPDADPSVIAGNVLLVTEEDYANEGDEVQCDLAGEFSTWWVPSLDHDRYLADAGESPFQPDQGTIAFLDSIHPVRDGFGSPTSSPADPFCSAHWFDYHQNGIVAQAYYSAGVYFIDVREPGDLAVYGYATARPSEVWDAYWFPLRDRDGIDTGRSTNVVMTADNVRGVDVFTVALPDEDLGAAPAPTASPTAAPAPEPTEEPQAEPAQESLPATGGGLAVAAIGAAVVGRTLWRRRR